MSQSDVRVPVIWKAYPGIGSAQVLSFNLAHCSTSMTTDLWLGGLEIPSRSSSWLDVKHSAGMPGASGRTRRRSASRARRTRQPALAAAPPCGPSPTPAAAAPPSCGHGTTLVMPHHARQRLCDTKASELPTVILQCNACNTVRRRCTRWGFAAGGGCATFQTTTQAHSTGAARAHG